MKGETKLLDMGEAAALVALGYGMARLDSPRNAYFKIFIFNQDAVVISKILNDYRDRKLMIEACTYWEAIRGIKKRIADMNILSREGV